MTLASRLSLGDPQAEEDFSAEFRPRLFCYFEGRTANRELAEDLTQEALLAALCSLRKGGLQEPDKLGAYVFGIARHTWHDRLRRQSREPLGGELTDLPNPAPAADSWELERASIARRVLATLDSIDRNILTLTLIEGIGPNEIATRLGLSSDAVRQRKSRAIRKLTLRLSQITGNKPQEE